MTGCMRITRSEQRGAGRLTDGADDVYVDALMARLANAGDAPVVRREEHDTTAADLRDMTFRYARALAGLGIERGSLVALFAPNTPEALAIRYATNLLGAAAVFLPAPSSSEHRAQMLTQTDAQLLVVFAQTAALVPDGVQAPIAAVGAHLPAASLRLDELAARESSSPVASRARPDDLAVIISSGGTTGVPKGSWRSFAAYTAMVTAPSPANRRQLANGPLAHLTQVLVDTTLLGGGVVVLQDGCDPARTLATIESEAITDLFLVEPQLFELMDHPDVGTRDLSSLRAITHIGASAPPTLRLRARRRLGPVLAHTYGASEVGIVSGLSPAEHDLADPEAFTCAGHLRPGVQVRLRRTDGSMAEPGEECGGIEVHSPAMAGGYRNRPVEQAAAFHDGWYRTGDIGRFDAQGRLHILGRASDIRRVDGIMIIPTAVEDTLCRLSTVEYAVIAVDRTTGTWFAAVRPWPGLAVDPAACRAAIAAEHGDAAAEPVVIVPVERMPLTEQGKPDRTAIRLLGDELRAPALVLAR